MKRRDFFRNLGGLFVVSTLSPSILKALERSDNTESTLKLNESTTIKDLHGYITTWDEESRQWTEAFFRYLKKNNVGFKWERVFSPVFKTKTGRVYICETRKCANFNPNWKATGAYEIKWQSFSGNTENVFYAPETFEEYQEKIFVSICRDILLRKRERVYFYQMGLTSIMYNPMDFSAMRWVYLRGVEI